MANQDFSENTKTSALTENYSQETLHKSEVVQEEKQSHTQKNGAQAKKSKFHFSRSRKRQVEIFLAIVILAIVIFVTWGQLTFFGTDSWIFFVLVNVNAILMLIVLFLVARNVVSLLLERRRKIFGARLRTRLVLAFFSISFIPILIMFLSSNKILTTSVNYWFTSQVENSMQAALNVGQSFYTAATARLRVNLDSFARELLKYPQSSWENLITDHKLNNNLSLIGIIEENNKNIVPNANDLQNLHQAKYQEKLWNSNENFGNVWQSIRHSINFQNIKNSSFESLHWADASADFVIVAVPLTLNDNSNLYLIGAESIGKGLLTQLNNISTGFQEYNDLKNLKQPLKLSFSLILGLLSLIVLFGSVWLAFRISKELTEPILAMAKSTEQIASGDWDIKIIDKGQDELGQLVHSFNVMTAELKFSQERLQKMNWLIEEKNLMLIERNQYIEAILEYVSTGIVTLDEQGILTTINKAACDIFKIRAEQYEGLSIFNFLSKEKAEKIREMYAFIQENPSKTWANEMEFALQEQYLKVLIQAVTLPSFTKNMNNFHDNAYLSGNIILVIEDITELSKEQRLAAWKEVAKRIAHEIKNPLTPIKLSTERIQRKFSHKIDDPIFIQCTDLIIKEVDRMQSMVSDFSSLASLPQIKTEPENLMPILQELINLFKTSHPAIEWNLNYKSSIPMLMLDKTAMHRALFNILNNAADAINSEKHKLEQEHNTVHKDAVYQGIVKITCYGSDENSIELNNEQAVFVEILDNGTGISHEEALQLFEPYFSKKASGTGLGLTIVRSIISDHGGQISAYKQNKGTLIKIKLPYKNLLKINT